LNSPAEPPDGGGPARAADPAAAGPDAVPPLPVQGGGIAPRPNRVVGVLSVLKSEFGHAPVCFVSGIVATVDVMFRTVEAAFPLHPATVLKLPTPATAPPLTIGGSATLFVVALCLTVLSQNVVAYAWYKAIAWSSQLPTAILLSVSFVIFTFAAWLTAENATTFLARLGQIYVLGDFLRQLVLALISLFLFILTAGIAIALLEEYRSGDETKADQTTIPMILHLFGYGIMSLLLLAIMGSSK
jgi:hypothetical protein